MDVFHQRAAVITEPFRFAEVFVLICFRDQVTGETAMGFEELLDLR